MLFFLFALVFYCIPISIVILGFRWVLRKEGKKRKAKNFTKYAFIGLLTCLIGFSVALWISRRHVLEFELGNKFAIVLIATEQEGFLDFPVEFDMEITNLNTAKNVEFEFTSSHGPTMQFCTYPNFPSHIFIHEMNRGSYMNWIIDMSTATMETDYGQNKYPIENAESCVELTSFFELRCVFLSTN
ncbi:MAG: hypothetical protein GQ574_12275 [Crocinitomix sp.]|nr:hypothetical protein [Crocinitomix sp.]